MGSRKGWPKELADRCNAVGWPAELVPSGHWKAKLPDGTTMTWAESPSDRHAYKNAMRVARNRGLDALEEKMALEREKERLARIERDRERNGVPAAAYNLDPQPNESENEMKNADPSLGFVEVEGQRLGIVEQAEAWYQPNRGGDRRLVEDARELLLVDHSIHYQCLKGTGAFTGAGEVICHRLFTSPQGVFVHQARTHKVAEEAARQMQPRPASKAVEATLEVNVEAPAGAAPIPVSEPGLVARMVAITGQFEGLCNEIDAIGEKANVLYNELQGLVRELPNEVASEEMRIKAARFDAMLDAAQGLGQ